MTTYPAYTGDEPCTRRPELFFGEDSDKQRVNAAREHCAACPMQAPCLEWAIAHERHGIWAGTTSDDRKRIRRARGIIVESPPVWCWAVRGGAA